MSYNRNVFHALTMISQFGINMLVPIFICTFIGIAIDKKCGTSFWIIIFFFIGAAAGGRNVFAFARKIYEQPAQTRQHRKAEGREKEKGMKKEIHEQK